MKIYRFLNSNGNGLYQDDFYKVIGLAMSYEDIEPHQPPVTEDVRGLRAVGVEKVHCAFKDMRQLVSWFRYHNPLDVFINGGKLIEVEVPDKFVLHGSYQCAYEWKKIENVRDVSIDEFIQLIEPEMKNFKSFITW